jgi:outer membrane scaffolding protein for murein synthesis (MipA/OmpV family)
MFPISTGFAALSALLLAAPLAAEDLPERSETDASAASAPDVQAQPPEASARQGPPAGVPADGARGGPPFETVFDDTWVTVGIGAGVVPSYSGSDDYRLFPLPLIVGRVGGVGISPNGPGFNLDLLSKPSARPGSSAPSFSFGPSFRFRNDRNGSIRDDVVELAGELDSAFEVGANAGVSFPGVFGPRDRVSLSAQVRWDVAGAHDGMLIEPGVGYFTPVGRAASVQIGASASFVDDDFADYYYSVSPVQSASSGLAQFTADGGLNSIGTTGIVTVDLDGNALNGGLSVYAIAGYSRLIGDAADTPYTSERGSANQLIGGIGLGYTF